MVTVLFDLDGTLLDTLKDLTVSVNYALSKNDLPRKTEEEVRCNMGNGVKRLVEQSLPKSTDKKISEQVFKDFKEYYTSNNHNFTTPFPGIINLLSELKSDGIEIGIVSNKIQDVVMILNDTFFSDYVAGVWGESANVRRKPYPDLLLKAIDSLGCDKKAVIYVGDSEVDIECARNAGIKVVAVGWGFRDKDYLISLNPDYFIEKPSDLLDLIKLIEA